MKRTPLLHAALTAALIASVAQAQQTPVPTSVNPYLGTNITRTYSINELMNRPGLLTLGKGDMIFLDYDSDVDVIVTPQAALMDIPEPLGNLVVLTGKVSSGTAQLMIRLTNGKYTPFMINFTPGSNTMKRIRITDLPAVDFAQPVVQTPVASGSLPQYAAGGPNTYDLTRFLPAATTAPLNRTQPSWLAAGLSNQQNTVAITITNGGPRELRLSSKDLQLNVEGRAVPVNLSSDLTVGSGQTQVVTLPLGSAVSPDADLSATWLAYDAGANTYYNVTAVRR